MYLYKYIDTYSYEYCAYLCAIKIYESQIFDWNRKSESRKPKICYISNPTANGIYHICFQYRRCITTTLM